MNLKCPTAVPEVTSKSDGALREMSHDSKVGLGKAKFVSSLGPTSFWQPQDLTNYCSSKIPHSYQHHHHCSWYLTLSKTSSILFEAWVRLRVHFDP